MAAGSRQTLLVPSKAAPAQLVGEPGLPKPGWHRHRFLSEVAGLQQGEAMVHTLRDGCSPQ